MGASNHDLAMSHWDGLESKKGDYQYDECQAVLRSIDLVKLASHATGLNEGKGCRVEPQFAKAGRNIVRMLRFDDGECWIARFRIPTAFNETGPIYSPEDDSILIREVHCLKLVAQQTAVPVPQVFDYGMSSNGLFSVPYIIMNCLLGSCAFDLNRFIPQQFKNIFYTQMAYAQVQITNLTFPKIGTIVLRDDGNVDIGPIPGIGGPFKTATAYLRAWAEVARYQGTEDEVRKRCGPFSDEIWDMIVNFPKQLSRLASQICDGLNHGPFPLFHPDFGHQNMVVDTKYNVLGVIDWEHATTVPWHTVTLPYTLSITPPPMCPPQWYDANGQPVDDDIKEKHDDIEAYIQEVERAETDLKVTPNLSSLLRNQKVQNVAAAMELYVNHGKMGFYSRVFKPFEESEE